MKVKAVALDAMGVIFPEGDDLRSLLIPFVQARAGDLSEAEIAPPYRECYRNGATSKSLWEALGFDYGDGTLEDEFLATYKLTPGVVAFLESMAWVSTPIYGLSNDVAEWSVKRRNTFELDKHFAGWVISGELKTYKPDPRMYEALVAMLPCEPGECVFVDDRERNLNAARDHGLQTVFFGATSSEGHQVVSNFEELERLVLNS
jgi:putative hydrolase of the HAD superfamily